MREVATLSTTGEEAMLSVSHLTGVTPRSEKTVYMFEAESTVGYKQVKPGDLVINTMWAWMGAAGTARVDGIVSPAYGVYRIDPSIVDPRWVDYVIRTPGYVTEMTRYSRGVTSSRLRLYPDEFLKLSMPVPPLAEQRAIADYLDAETARIDALIAKKQQLIHLLEERLVAAARSLVTGGKESGPRWEPGPAWVGPVPVSWQPMKIAWHKYTGSGTTPRSDLPGMYDGGDTPWVTTAELRESLIESTAKCVTSDALRQYSALKVFPPGTLLVAMYGATVGRLGLLGVPATTNQACCAIYGRGDLQQEFLYWWLRVFRSDLVDLAQGAGQPNISQDTVRALRIPAPQPHHQLCLAKSCEQLAQGLGRAGQSLARQIELLAEHRQALITSAVLGAASKPHAA